MEKIQRLLFTFLSTAFEKRNKKAGLDFFYKKGVKKSRRCDIIDIEYVN